MRTGVHLAREDSHLLQRELLGWLVTCLIIAAATVFLFGDGVVYITTRWNEAEYSHGWVIPIVTLFVLWQRRAVIAATRGEGSWLGTLLVALALLLVVGSDMAFVRRGPFLALILLLVGLGYAALGSRAMRYALLPILFLFFAFPLPGSLAVALSTTLQLISSQIGAGLLQFLGVSVFLDGNIIDLGVYKLQVAEACSGLRYLFPLASFGFLCAWLYRGPFWARALILLSTVPITIVTNSARIALTGLFIEHGSVALAEGFMHLFEGWMIFLVALAILFAEMWLLSRLTSTGTSTGGSWDLLDFDRLAGGVAAAWPAPSQHVPLPLVACAGLLLAAIFSQGLVADRTQIVPDRPGLATFPAELGPWRGQSIPLTDQSVLRVLGASDYLLADYHQAGGNSLVNLWVAYYGDQLEDAAIHSPKECLPGGGWEYDNLSTITAPVVNNVGQSFLINRGVISKGLDRMIIYYWLDMRGRQLTNDTALKVYNLWDSYRMQRSDGALIRLMTPLAPNEPLEAADERLQAFLRQAYPALIPHVGL